MKELTQEDLKHIAEELDTSMEVYVHTKTKEILSIPSDSDFHEDEAWADTVKCWTITQMTTSKYWACLVGKSMG